MATDYVAPRFNARTGRANLSSGQWVVQYGKFTFPTAPVLNDTVLLLPIPAGFRVLHGLFKASDLDTGGSPAITLSVGDKTTSNLFWSAATIGQAGGATSLSGSALGKKYTADDYAKVLVAAGPATGAAGDVEVWLSGCFD